MQGRPTRLDDERPRRRVAALGRPPRRILRHPLGSAVLAAAVLLLLVVPRADVSAAVESQEARETFPLLVTAVQRVNVSYELNEAVPYSQAPADDSLGFTDEIAREGQRAGTVILRPDDPAYRGDLGYRAEWQSDFYADSGAEYVYGVSYYFPEDWNQGSNRRTFDDRIIFQFHEGNGKSPTFSLHLKAEDNRVSVRHRRPDGTFDHLWSMGLQSERWTDFAFRVKWTKDNKSGYFQIFVNGKLKYDYRGRTLNDSSRIYTKWGIYGQPTRLIVDEVRIIQGADGLTLATPANVATLLDPIPADGFGLVRFSGGTTSDLVESSNCADTARFWATDDGRFISYIAGSPAFVNRDWNERFAEGIEGETPLIASCG